MAHISLVTLGVADVARATAFYEALGWRRSSASVEGVVSFLTGGAVVLGLFGADDLAADAGVEPDPGPPVAPRSALAVNLGSEVEVDTFLATAEAAGGTVTRPAHRAEWGGYSGYVHDLDGHLWEAAHNPGFGLLPDGRIELPDAG